MFDANAYGLGVEVGLSPAGGDATMAVEYANLSNGVIRLSADFQTYLDYLKTGVQTEADTFQETFAANSVRCMSAVWDCAAMELPSELTTADVIISVL